MDITFALRGIEGHVNVTYSLNDRPELVGSSAESWGFPMCTRRSTTPLRVTTRCWAGSNSSDDNTSHGRAFEIDPLDILGDVPHPFCWIGLSPRLFDAPSRSPRRDLDWVAHSFLCVPDGSVGAGLDVQALLGFAWGFSIRNEEIHLAPPTQLGTTDWDHHVDALAARYPSWRFDSGFRED
jgi:hypothetical protein